MKIVVTGTRGIPGIMGGVETHCEELFPRIARKGFDVTVIRRKSYVHDTLRQYEGITLVDLATPKKKSFEAIVHTFRAVLEAKKLKAEIIHIHAVGPALLTPVARLLGLKVVFTHHGPDYDRDKWGAAAKTVLRLGEMMGARFANEIIVISNVINDMLIRKYHRKECHLIYNGVPAPQIVDFPEYLEETGVEKGKYIFSMCRFVPEKNLHHLIEAFSKTDNKGCRLVLAGDTDFEDEYSAGLKKYAREQGVVLTGFIKGKKLHALLTHARCFVLPSSHEGLPIALLEAMSYRLPVIVSDIPANLEVGLEKEAYFPQTLPFPADLSHGRPDECYQLCRGDFQLQAPDAGADIDERMLPGRRVDISREALFHADRRTAAAYITRHGQQFLHRNQIGLLVARHAGRGLEIDLMIPRHHADEVSRPIAFQHEGLENRGDLLAQLFSDVRRRQMLFVHLVGNELVIYLRTVEQPRRIRLFDFSVCHLSY